MLKITVCNFAFEVYRQYELVADLVGSEIKFFGADRWQDET